MKSFSMNKVLGTIKKRPTFGGECAPSAQQRPPPRLTCVFQTRRSRRFRRRINRPRE